MQEISLERELIYFELTFVQVLSPKLLFLPEWCRIYCFKTNAMYPSQWAFLEPPIEAECRSLYLYFRNALNIVKDDLIAKVDELSRWVWTLWKMI